MPFVEHHYKAEYGAVRIRPLQHADIELLRQWRNNSSLSEFLNPIGEITPEMQEKWYKEYLADPDIATFAIEEIQNLNRVVGSVAIYRFRGDEAEVGKIVVGDPEAKGKKIGYYGLLLAMEVGFRIFGIQTYFLSVHEDNLPARKIYSYAGFVQIGKHHFVKGGEELEMMLKKAKMEVGHDFLQEVCVSTI